MHHHSGARKPRHNQQHNDKYVTHRWTSQLSKTRCGLVTPSPPHHTRDYYKYGNDRGSWQQKHTPRTSRATLPASAASTSRHTCSVDYRQHHNNKRNPARCADYTCTTKRTKQWSYPRRSSRDLSATATPHPVKQHREQSRNKLPTHLLCDHVRQCRVAPVVTCELFCCFTVADDGRVE